MGSHTIRILLTGATGFIGSAFLRKAIQNGWSVRIIVRNANSYASLQGVEIIEGDLSEPMNWDFAVKDIDLIVNTAAELKDKRIMHRVNFEGPSRLLRAAVSSGVNRWVQLSSVGAYGRHVEGVITEETPERPASIYETTKARFDELLNRESQGQNIETSIIRPSNVYGKGMRNNAIKDMLRLISLGLFVFVGSPGSSANYVHVDDVVNALELCVLRSEAKNKTYIVSDWTTIEDMVYALSSGSGNKHLLTFRIPLQIAKLLSVVSKCLRINLLTSSRVMNMTLRTVYSTKKIRNELGWIPSVNIKEGLSQTAKYLCR